jgi:hypothetical protein
MSKPKALTQHRTKGTTPALSHEERVARFATVAAGLVGRGGRGAGPKAGRPATPADAAGRIARFRERAARVRGAVDR